MKTINKFLILALGVAIIVLAFAVRSFMNPHLEKPIEWETEEATAVPSIVAFQPGPEFLLALDKAQFSPISISGLPSDLAKATAVLAWAHKLWKHNGENDPDTSDPKVILERAQAGEKFRCVEYSVMAAAAARSVGLNARVVGLRTREVETTEYGAGHVVGEIYLDDMKKWVMADAQWGLIPFVDGNPINAAEFAAALGKKDIKFMGPDGKVESNARYIYWISPYLYYIAFRIDQRLDVNPRSFDQIILVPKGAKVPEKFQRNPMPGKVFPAFAVSSVYAF